MEENKTTTEEKQATTEENKLGTTAQIFERLKSIEANRKWDWRYAGILGLIIVLAIVFFIFTACSYSNINISSWPNASVVCTALVLCMVVAHTLGQSLINILEARNKNIAKQYDEYFQLLKDGIKRDRANDEEIKRLNDQIKALEAKLEKKPTCFPFFKPSNK